MPVHNTGGSISSIITFRTSPLFEMLVSLGGIAASWRLQEFTQEAKDALGSVFISDVRAFYEEFYSCCSLVELAIDYPDHDDVEGFFSYIDTMDDRTFAFYALGRWLPRSEFECGVNSEIVRRLFTESRDREALEQHYPRLGWLDDIPALKMRLITMWRTYWHGFMRHRIADLEPKWHGSIIEKQRILDDRGGEALIEHLTHSTELPDPIPADMPYTRVIVIPIYHADRPKTVHYGYGSAHILYDCARTEEHAKEVEATGERTLAGLKALADENRLKILKLISHNERFLNGKSIAKKLALSPSVVSRHIAQLKSAGFVEEYSPDNRNITYDFNLERIRALSADIEDFIKD